MSHVCELCFPNRSAGIPVTVDGVTHYLCEKHRQEYADAIGKEWVLDFMERMARQNRLRKEEIHKEG